MKRRNFLKSIALAAGMAALSMSMIRLVKEPKLHQYLPREEFGAAYHSVDVDNTGFAAIIEYTPLESGGFLCLDSYNTVISNKDLWNAGFVGKGRFNLFSPYFGNAR